MPRTACHKRFSLSLLPPLPLRASRCVSILSAPRDDCPPTANCFCRSLLFFVVRFFRACRAQGVAKAWLESQPRTKIETETDGYLHAKSLSFLFGFPDSIGVRAAKPLPSPNPGATPVPVLAKHGSTHSLRRASFFVSICFLHFARIGCETRDGGHGSCRHVCFCLLLPSFASCLVRFPAHDEEAERRAFGVARGAPSCAAALIFAYPFSVPHKR